MLDNGTAAFKRGASESGPQNRWIIAARATRHNAMKLDKKDLLILEALQRDARQSLAAMGKRIDMCSCSTTALATRRA